MRQYNGVDRLIQSFDQALRSLVPGATAARAVIRQTTHRPI